MQKLHNAERYYTPWLYDLAFLEHYFLQRKGLHSDYVIDIPTKEGYLSDTVPFPELLPTLTFTLSYLEKGLKFITLVITDYDHDTVYKKKHNLPKIFELLPEAYKNDFCEFTKKEKIYFKKLLEIKYTNIRYLETQNKFYIRIDILESIILKFKKEVIRIRNCHIYNNELTRADFINIQKSKNTINVRILKKKIEIKSFKKETLDNKLKLTSDEELQSIRNLGFLKIDNYSKKEVNFIKECYDLLDDQYLLKKNIKLKELAALIRLIRKEFIFNSNNFSIEINSKGK